MFQRLAEMQYSSFHGTLSCGKLNSSIVLSPTPQPYTVPGEIDNKKRIAQTIEICGFLDVSDVGSPMVLSRHLVLPFGKGLSICMFPHLSLIYFKIYLFQMHLKLELRWNWQIQMKKVLLGMKAGHLHFVFCCTVH